MSFGSSTLGGVQQGKRDQLETCVKLLLLWVAASDGRLDESELEFAASRFPDAEGSTSTRDLLAIIRKSDLGAMEAAILVVAEQSRELRTAFLDTAIAMCMADREIAVTENHLLRFLADALYLGAGVLEKRFRAISGGPLAPPGDPSSPAWWEQLASGEKATAADPGALPEAPPAASEDSAAAMTVAQARAVLGLDHDAGPRAIEEAYRNLSAIFDPARVSPMGEAAIRVASRRLHTIQQAYDRVRG